jgi:hypothetical protein
MVIDELSRATGLGFLISQVFILVFLMLYYKEPQATLFSVRMVNATSLQVEVTADEYGISMVYMLTSACGAVMSFMTAQMQETAVIDNMVEFSDELMSTLYAWDCVLWAIVFLTHGIVAVLVCSPAVIYMLCLAVFGITAALQQMCAPGRRRSDSLALILFMLLSGLVYSEMHTRHGLRLLAWTALLMSDVILVVGHAFDAHSNMETVANCRVFYCSLALVLLLVLYTV